MSDAEIREALARAERARRHVNGLCIGTMKWRMRVPPQADDSDLVICNALDDSKRLAADLLAARAERDEARAFIRDFLHTTSGKKSLDGAPLSRLESAAQRLLSPTPSHTCQIHRASAGASDCGLSPCEEAQVHRDRGAARPKMRCAICGLVEHVGRCASSPPPSPEATPFEADTMTHEEAKCATCGGRGTVCAVPDGYHHGCANPAHAKPCPDCHGCGGGA